MLLETNRLTVLRACVAVLGVLALGFALSLGCAAHPALAADTPGQVQSTGYNPYGELGDGTDEVHDSFSANPFLPPNVLEASGGGEASLYLLANGTVQGSGHDLHGELGDGSEYARFVPETVPTLGAVTAVSEGAYQSLELLSNGTVQTSGLDEYGELGNGEALAGSGCDCLTSPMLVDGVDGAGKLEDVVAIADGYYNADALLSDGHVVTWGFGLYGDLGDGATKQSNVPVEVLGVGGKGKLEGVTAISTGFHDSVALLSNGHVVTWGENVDGELGDGTTTQSEVPVEVLGVGGEGKLESVLAVSAGGDFDLALLSDGKVLAWGYNRYGELGDGDAKQSDVPVEVPGIDGSGTLGGVTSISADAYSALATTSSHTLVGWGDNDDGELGDGSYEQADEPVPIPGVSGVVSLGHGDYAQDSLLIEGSSAQISTTALGFATQIDTTSAPQSVVLTDDGPAPLVVSGVVLSGSPAFSKSSDGCTGETLPAGASCTVTLAFAPTAAEGYGATLAFSSSAANALPAVTIGGAGVAVPAPPPRIGRPTISIRRSGITLRKGRLRFTLSCAVAGCDGTARLTTSVDRAKRRKRRNRKSSSKRKRSRARSGPLALTGLEAASGHEQASKKETPKRRTLVLGTAHYKLAAGRHEIVSIALTRAALERIEKLRRGSSLRTTLVVSVARGDTARLVLKLT